MRHSIFNQILKEILKDYLEYCEIFIDDILIHSSNEEQHYKHLKEVLKRLKEAEIRLKMAKCKWMVKEVEYCGFLIKDGTCTPLKNKLEGIQAIKAPNSKKKLHSFIGLCNWFRSYIPDISVSLRILIRFLHEYENFVKEWTEKEQVAFETLKERMKKCQH